MDDTLNIQTNVEYQYTELQLLSSSSYIHMAVLLMQWVGREMTKINKMVKSLFKHNPAKHDTQIFK